ncbi:MAG: transposase domain-containing protein [Planctomycetales bacterium]|nr:transposase domain-containing protein [Planctomycetales bacterium]
MDIFTTLIQTTKKLGISGYAYLRDRIARAYQLSSIADLIINAAANHAGA